ncbi:MAG: tripartite tricarboxylate transporter substrate binding protein [Paracoccaceae bacterium]|nr:tripartite tricarboxylate transporter substrate binding protein [Paracoccaceae bacterium]
MSYSYYRFALQSLALLSLTVLSGLPAPAAPADFYDQQTIRLIVGTKPGGGYDALARLLAPEIASLTGASVLVQNKPGAGGLLVVNDAVRGAADGLDLTLVNVSGAVSAQIIGFEAARFDVRDLKFIGGIASDDRVILVPAAAPAGSPFLTPGTVRWSALGKTDNLAISAALLSEAFGLNSRIITGYGGSGEAITALLRGEADAVAVSLESAQAMLGPQTVRIAAVLSRTRSPAAPEVPTVFELADARVDQEWLDFLIGLTSLSRSIIVPPGTPAERVDYLASTIKTALTDADFIARADAQGRSFSYTSPDTVKAEIAAILARTHGDNLSRLLNVVLQKYY